MKVKLCGIRIENDVHIINEFLPDYAGFVFAKSKRQVTEDTCKALTEMLNPKIKPVGVFVNEDINKLIEIVKYCDLHGVQLHGEETEQYIRMLKEILPELIIIKAVSLKDEETVEGSLETFADYLLFDTYSLKSKGGTGQRGNLEIVSNLRNKINKPFFLAGGINAENLEELSAFKPYGVDASSGIEGVNGYKDYEKIREFIKRSNRL